MEDKSPLLSVSLTYEGISDVGPVNAALQLQLVVGLDVEKEMLVEANASDQMSPVGTFQGAPTVDVLGTRKVTKYAQSATPSAATCSSEEISLPFLALESQAHLSSHTSYPTALELCYWTSPVTRSLLSPVSVLCDSASALPCPSKHALHPLS